MTERIVPILLSRAPRPVLVAVLALALAACATGEPPGAETAVADSAGVQLVTLPEARPPRWTVDPEPLRELGVAAGEDAYLFEGIVGAFVADDGSITVCNGGDRTIRRYGPTGALEASGAGQGDGPSELRLLRRCFLVGNDVWVYQAPFQPIKVYTREGSFVRAVEMPRPGDWPALLLDVSPDGALVLRQDAPRRVLPEGVGDLPAVILRGPGTDALDTIFAGVGDRWVREGPLSFPAAFTPVIQAVALGEWLVVGWPETLDLSVYAADGSLVRRIRGGSEPVPATAAHRRALEERILFGPMPSGDMPYQSDDVRRRIVEMMRYPDRLPAHYRLMSDAAGALWVERGDAPRDPLPHVAEPYPAATVWDVLHLDGRRLGAAVLPERFDPLEIGVDYVVGVHHDELGVERVHVHRLSRLGG